MERALLCVQGMSWRKQCLQVAEKRGSSSRFAEEAGEVAAEIDRHIAQELEASDHDAISSLLHGDCRGGRWLLRHGNGRGQSCLQRKPVLSGTTIALNEDGSASSGAIRPDPSIFGGAGQDGTSPLRGHQPGPPASSLELKKGERLRASFLRQEKAIPEQARRRRLVSNPAARSESRESLAGDRSQAASCRARLEFQLSPVFPLWYGMSQKRYWNCTWEARKFTY